MGNARVVLQKNDQIGLSAVLTKCKRYVLFVEFNTCGVKNGREARFGGCFGGSGIRFGEGLGSLVAQAAVLLSRLCGRSKDVSEICLAV